MKSMMIICVLLLCFLMGSTSRVRKYKSSAIKRGLADNIYFKFALGAIEQIGGNEKDIEGCLPQAWKTQASTDKGSSIPAIEGSSTILNTMLKYLDMGIDAACKFKDKVIEFFKKKLGVRRYRRRLIQLQKINGKRNPFDSIVDIFKTLNQKVTDLLNSPILKTLEHFYTCFKVAKTSVSNIKTTIEGFYQNIKKLLSGLKGFIEVGIDLICKWKKFKEAIDFLNAGIKATDNLMKWYSYGKFVGKLVHTIGN